MTTDARSGRPPRRSPQALSPRTNWAGNYSYEAAVLHRPATLEQVQEVVAAAPRVRVLGSRHSFTGIADSAELVSLEALPADVVVDPRAGTVSFGGGLTYGQLTDALRGAGVALHNLASLPHISVAGAVATATHGSGVGNGNLATAVAGLEMVTSDGAVVRCVRGEPDFDGMVVGLGALGAVTRLTLDVEPAYEVAQQVFEDLSWDALYTSFEEIAAAAYSVSLFTRWGPAVDMVWLKSRTDRDVLPAGDLHGAAPAATDRHPVPGVDPSPATEQHGRPGSWADRLPHFRAGFTPSTGNEIQSEYLVPHRHAVDAIEALRSLGDRMRPLLHVAEIRTMAADRLWMSTAYGEPAVGFHFTWLPEQPAVEALLPDLERALAPFGARPHWGKLFAAEAPAITALYERHADFARLVARLDPRGAFRNAWLDRHVLGAG